MLRFSCASVLLALCLVPGPVRHAGATTVVRFEFDSLCVRAEAIAHVRCVESRSFRDAETGRIFTRTRLAVLAPIKGAPEGDIVLRLPGGTVDGQRLMVPGIPRFAPGEETVLFLSGPDASGSPWPLGLGQGCYIVQAEGEGGRYVLLQAGVTPLPKGALFKPASHRPFRVPLQDFLDRIQQSLPSSPAGR